jgi:hypothetical protein
LIKTSCPYSTLNFDAFLTGASMFSLFRPPIPFVRPAAVLIRFGATHKKIIAKIKILYNGGIRLPAGTGLFHI